MSGINVHSNFIPELPLDQQPRANQGQADARSATPPRVGGDNGPLPAPPAATPQARATDEAAEQLRTAREALASMQDLAAQGHGFAQAELAGGYLQQNVATARAALVQAVADEIAALVAADPGLDEAAALQAILERHGDDPALQAELRDIGPEAGLQVQVDGIVDGLPQSSDPVADLYALDQVLTDVSSDVRERVLAHPDVQALIDRAGSSINAPVQPYLAAGNQRSDTFSEDLREALIALEQVSSSLDPELAAVLVDRALDDYEHIQREQFDGQDIIFGRINTGDAHGNSYEQLARIASHVHGSEQGAALIDRLIDLNSEGEGWDSALQAIGTNPGAFPASGGLVGPALFIALENRGIPLSANGESAAIYAMGPILYGIDVSLQPLAEDYFQLVETLHFAQQMRPMFDSQEAYDSALDTLMRDKLGDDWKEQVAAAEEQLASGGSQLLSQLAQYMDLPPEHEMRAEVDRFVQDVLSNPAAQAAISFALQRDPGLAEGALGEHLLDLFATPGLDAGGQALAAEFGNLYVLARTGQAFSALDGGDPASVTAAQSAVAGLDDPRLATVLGVDPEDLSEAVAALSDALPGLAGDTAQQESAQRVLDGALEAIAGFGADDPAGQVIRGLAMAATGSAYINANDLALNDPRVESFIDLAMQNLNYLKGTGLTAKSLIGVAVNSGLVSSSGMIGKFGLGNSGAGPWFAAVGIVTNSVGAIQAAREGDMAMAQLHNLAAVGTMTGLIYAGTWLGPVGWAVAAIAAVGIGVLAETRHNNRFETDEMRDFLAASGLSDAAAAQLYNTTGNAVSPVPFLLHYADSHGLSVEQAIDYFNQLAETSDLRLMVQIAHHTIDESGSNGTGLPATHESDAEIAEYLESPYAIIPNTAHSLAQFDMIMDALGIPLPE